MDIKNINSELSNGDEGQFLDVLSFNEHTFGACSISGVSPVWEMHPDTDEFFHILEGEAEFVLLEESREKKYTAPAGSVFAIPKGIWHKPGAPKGVKFMYFTPGETLHSEADDPRTT